MLEETAKIENKVYFITNKTSFIKAGSATPRFEVSFGPNYQAKDDFVTKVFKKPALPDSGATRTILPHALVMEKNLKYINAPEETLVDASENEMSVIGKLSIQARFKDKVTLLNCIISDSVSEIICLGLIC